MNLYTECLHIIGAVCATREVGQVELDLVPSLVQSHGHGTNERLDTSCRLVVTGPKPSPHVLVIENLIRGGNHGVTVLCKMTKLT